ncbi:hypothetical protein [Nocardiopsis ganjiahuensis]|uniref:hypothetical protein n=1 Tax=Nocardiopsis ganjiahuensis TaxID=239984 RepID=UPI000349FC4B|nr:hypothetical protein [Nocardiopsis ganjiahuensis]
MKPLGEMTTEELTEALEALDDARPKDTALRLALYLELRRAAADEWLFEDGSESDGTEAKATAGQGRSEG